MTHEQTHRLYLLQRALESQLEKIEAILGPQYRLTLVANYQGDKDADIVLTMSTRERILVAIDRFLPAPASEANAAREARDGDYSNAD